MFDLGVSPQKNDETADSKMIGPSSRRRMDTSRTPSDRSTSRTAPVKRNSVAALGRPPGSNPDSLWEDDIRAVHRRVQYPDDPNASVKTALEALQRQSEADREHMALLKGAIETIYVSQRQQMIDVTSGAQRADRIEAAQDRDRAMTRAELYCIANELPMRINASVEVKTQSFGVELAKVQAYLVQLDTDRPVEGVTLVESFRLLDNNIAEMKAKLNAYSQQTEGKIAAAQGAATAMPESEVVILNEMFRELNSLKTWSATVATKVEI